MSKVKVNLSLLLVLAGQVALSAVFIFSRTMDADEGFYLAAAQRVADGMVPYRDFFFPQMPLLPYLTFSLADWGIISLFLGRCLAALVGLLLTITIYRVVLEHTDDKRQATIAAFLAAFSGLFLTWHDTFKPYAFVDLFLVMSFGLLLSVRKPSGNIGMKIFLTMLTLGIAINFRSIFALLIPVYLIFEFAAARRESYSVQKALLAATAGILIPSILSLILFANAPSNFLFDNLLFHLQREPIEGILNLIMFKATVVGKFLILPQTIFLLGMVIASHFLAKFNMVTNHTIYRYSAFMALIVGAIYLIPTPNHLQYFEETLPFLIIAGLPAASFLISVDKSKLIYRSAALLYIVGIFPFVYLFIAEPRDQDKRFTWSHLRTVVNHIQNNSAVDDTLLSEWAGYAALSDRAQLPGSEHVGFHYPLKIEAAEYASKHLLTSENIVQALGDQRPELVVVDYQVYPAWQEALTANYHLIETADQTFIYKKNHATL